MARLLDDSLIDRPVQRRPDDALPPRVLSLPVQMRLLVERTDELRAGSRTGLLLQPLERLETDLAAFLSVTGLSRPPVGQRVLEAVVTTRVDARLLVVVDGVASSDVVVATIVVDARLLVDIVLEALLAEPALIRMVCWVRWRRSDDAIDVPPCDCATPDVFALEGIGALEQSEIVEDCPPRHVVLEGIDYLRGRYNGVRMPSHGLLDSVESVAHTPQ
ncbi:hypothetical protein QIT48_gp11 [Haloterrigena jeotgali icosahedral virus 1]|uniref:Uncharacterized protein n=2 Tax=root TaxID=1 RepID=A0AAF0T4E7_9EURY|nr:hypothetical protein [Natrinema thermotolerans]YP_010772649.1 hypothetical protein QIT48_gp11 [Haloterrigena jeotgali icosahedral virus 1]QCC57413.1 hypothetical protein DVR14_01665 [Natrinema thermotolerans]WMT10382.1 hypothetical protein NP511_22730 [Natrinema thermotolerans]DAC85289.1 TPA_asm: hypothetical protein HJIV1gp11 [Haloterrigena jeotgali icosahedral virus 1]